MSGSTIGGVAGALIGGYIGGPQGAQIGFAVGSMVGGYIDPEHIAGPRLGEMPIQTSQEGAPRPIVFGTPEPFAGNLMMAGPKLIVNVEEQAGGKGGGPVVETQKVYQSYAVRICEGRAEGVVCLKAWRDGKLIRDMTGTTVIAAENVIFQSISTFYPGDETQLPDSVLESFPAANGGGVGNVPAHRGTAYMVIYNDDLTPTGGRIPNYTFLMSAGGSADMDCTEAGLRFHFPCSNAISGGVADELVNGYNGIYSPRFGPTDTVVPGDDLNVYGTGSMRMLTINDYMVAYESYYSQDDPFAFPAPDPNWTVSCWFALDDTESLIGKVWGNIACCYGDPQFGTVAWGFMLNGEDNLIPEFRTNHPDHSATIIQGQGIGPGLAHFLCATYDENDRGGTIKFYQDGQKVGEATGQLALGRFIHGGEGAIVVGGGYYPNSYGWKGQVSDVKGYGLTLDEDEVYSRFLRDDGSVREAPDAPGLYVFPNGQTSTICDPSAEFGVTTLADILRDIGRRVGLDESQLELDAAEDVEVEGFLVARQMTASAAVAPLMLAYFSDFPEYDLQLHWVPRGGPVVAGFEDGDFLDEHPNDSWRFNPQTELPKKVQVFFCDKDANYARVPVPAWREAQGIVATGEFNIELPLVLTRDAAQQKAWIYLKVTWEEAQGELVREIPTYKWAHLVPSNPITYGGKRWRIEKMEPADGRTKITAKRDRASNYQSDAVAGVVLDPTAPVSNVKGPSHLQMLNLPRLRTQDSSPGMYGFVTGVMPAWPGAQIYLSVDGGLTETLVATIGYRATMGQLLDYIDADDDPIRVSAWDNRLLTSASAEELAADANGFAITTDGVSEVCQFADAANDSNGDWLLSNVLRGQLHTDAVEHFEGDPWVMLDDKLFFIPIDSSHIGKTLIFRAVTRGTPIENNPTISVVYDPLFTNPEIVDFLEDSDDERITTNDGSFFQIRWPTL